MHMRALFVRALFGALVIATSQRHAGAQSPATQPAGFASYKEAVPHSVARIDMVPVRGGHFRMAARLPEGAADPGEVRIPDLWVAATEITYDQFDVYSLSLDLPQAEKDKDDRLERWQRARPSKPYGDVTFGFGQRGFPALAMTYKSAERYCQWLSKGTGRTYRLPTEIEWEYFARAGGAADIGAEQVAKVAWFKENSDDKAHASAELTPNAWGLYDTLGNACEWCTGVDGKPVTRGGSWRSKPDHLSFALREPPKETWHCDPQDPKSTWWLSCGSFVGFRIVREADEPRRE